jgi:serine/threonine-protein kinase/endoribonuclease IRE1
VTDIAGNLGWQAPEVLRHQRQTRASDIFSRGCVFSFCLRDGQHPFGDGDDSERADNILKNKKCITSAPEVEDLISKLLHPIPEQRYNNICQTKQCIYDDIYSILL